MDQKYRDMVAERLKNNSSDIFGNFTTEHAGYIIEQFIGSAQESIEILQGSFADCFYTEITVKPLLEAAAKRIDKEDGIRIITVNGKRFEALEQVVDEVNQKVGKQVIRYIPAQCNNPDKVNHYMIVDDIRYRLEDPHEVVSDGESPKCVKAEVCCNGPQKATQLLADFNEIWDMLQR